MPKIFIEGKAYEIREGMNLLHAALSLGFDLPYFCWHPALGSVGACRQCAVKQFSDEKDAAGKIVIACMKPASDGTRISIQDAEAREFRKSVIEWLMTNHPHDCPVCDEGGECHLQDMTVMTGHNLRRYRFGKRTHLNQYLGPFVNHEMNRCIACYRCVRYYRDFAGGKDLDVFSAHNDVYFGRSRDGILESEFSGNLVEVCPTGVFTDKTLKEHYTRKWDFQNAPSICPHCSLGCNTIAGERYGRLRRIVNRYNHEVNGYFLCDRGRYGYEFVSDPRRALKPMASVAAAASSHAPADTGGDAAADAGGPATLPPGGQQAAIGVEEALGRARSLCLKRDRVIGIGSPRASVESNYALRTLVGKERFFSGMSLAGQPAVERILAMLRTSPVRIASLRDVELSDAVLLLGEDVTNTAPLVDLALRQAAIRQPRQQAARMKIPDWDEQAIRGLIQQQRGPFFIATPAATKLDGLATLVYRASPAGIARLGGLVAAALGRSAGREEGPAPAPVEGTEETAATIARALKGAARPLVVSGAGLMNEPVLEATMKIARALSEVNPDAAICLTVPECNSIGAALLEGRGLGEAMQLAREGKIDTAVIVENDLYRRAPAGWVEEFLRLVPHVVVIDHLSTPTARKAELFLPAGAFAEASGTLVNNEGRAQRFFRAYVPPPPVRESWRWIGEIGGEGGWPSLDAILDSIARELPGSLSRITGAAPPSGFRIEGQKIPREPHRYSGRTAMAADRTMHEPKPPDDPDSPLSYSMEGYYGNMPSELMPFFWAPGWNSVQATNKFQKEVGSLLKGGTAGIRLIEPAPKPPGGAPVQMPSAQGAVPPRPGGKSASGAFPEARPGAVQPAAEPPAEEAGQWLAVPLYHIFGSEEMSALSPPVAELIPQPYVAMNPADVETLDRAPAPPRGGGGGVRTGVSAGGFSPAGGPASPASAEEAGAGDQARLRRLLLRVSFRDGKDLLLPLLLLKDLPRGVVGIPSGLPGVEWFPPSAVKLSVAEAEESP